MREKFFNKGSYLLRLDDIRPKEAKPNKRIHLNCSMELTEDEVQQAPTRIRRVWEIVANPQLDTFHVPISSQLKGIEIELFPTMPEKDTPTLLCIKNSILRDIRIDREKVDEKNWTTRLCFSLGISWDSNVWKWGEDYVFMECYAQFSQSQSELFDDNPADAVIATPEAERLWKWGEDYVFMECYAQFSQSQSELFDDNPADAVIATPEAERLRNAEVED